MSILQVLVLAIIQGLTEFFPVSSSAHLVLVPALLHWPTAPVVLDAALHFGTLLALLVYFFADVVLLLKAFFSSFNRKRVFSDEEKGYVKLAWWIIVGTIPVVILGLLFKKTVEASFSAPLPAAIMLLVTGVYLALADLFAKPRRTLTQLGTIGALVIGIGQAASLLRGISRSGATMATGMFVGLNREAAARFAFLLSIPAILGAFILEIITIPLKGASNWLQLILGTAIACGVGILCIHTFLRLVKRIRLVWFSLYCWAFGLFAIFMLILH